MFRVAVPGRRTRRRHSLPWWYGAAKPSMPRSLWPTAAGSWWWAGWCSGRRPPRRAAPGPWSRSWPRAGAEPAVGTGPNRALRESLSTERNDGGFAVGHLGARGQCRRHTPQPGLRERITLVSPGQSQKMPSGDRDVSSSRTSLAKSSTRSPKRCGAEEDIEK
jgi:hypothetical protein